MLAIHMRRVESVSLIILQIQDAGRDEREEGRARGWGGGGSFYTFKSGKHIHTYCSRYNILTIFFSWDTDQVKEGKETKRIPS